MLHAKYFGKKIFFVITIVSPLCYLYYLNIRLSLPILFPKGDHGMSKKFLLNVYSRRDMFYTIPPAK